VTLPKKHNLTVERYYDASAETIEHDANAMGWASTFTQTLRFDVMNHMVDMDGTDVLDVGCGDGALFHYFESKQMAVSYNGIDVSANMVARAKRRHAGIQVQQCDLFDYDQTHSVVVCSGSLNMSFDQDPYEFLAMAIDQLLRLAKEHVVFNLLTDRADVKDPLLNVYSPSKVLDLCLSKTPYVSINHAYLPNDFTVHLVKT
jgi:predicted TPR repeat methyltransferase